MSCLRVLVSVVALCLAGVSARAQTVSPSGDWTQISEEENYTQWASKPKTADDLTSIAILFQYDQPRPHLDHWMYRSVRQNFLFDCKRKVYRVVSLEMHTDEWGASEVIYRRKFDEDMTAVLPGSKASIYAKPACDGAK